MNTRATGEDSQPGSDNVALTRSPGFWVIVRYAILFGVVLAFLALAFLQLVNRGTNLWFTLPEDPGWLDGSLWWVAVTAGAGLLVLAAILAKEAGGVGTVLREVPTQNFKFFPGTNFK